MTEQQGSTTPPLDEPGSLQAGDVEEVDVDLLDVGQLGAHR